MHGKTLILWLLPVLIVVIGALLFAGCSRRGGTEEPSGTKASGTPKTAVLRFDSFDGGGPEYSVTVEDPSIVSYASAQKYYDKNHAELDGAGYEMEYTFTGLKAGETTVTVSSYSPIMDAETFVYTACVDDALQVTLTAQQEERTDQAIQPTPVLVVHIGEKTFYGNLADNAAADAFRDQLSTSAVEVGLQDNGGFEKVGALPWTLPRCDETITTEPGDILLNNGDQISFCYGENTGELTRLAKIEGATREDLLAAFGDADTTADLWVEWSE